NFSESGQLGHKDPAAATSARTVKSILALAKNELFRDSVRSCLTKRSRDMKTGLPEVVDQAQWQKQSEAFRVKEKAATKALDALAAERRRLPMVRIDTPYAFDSPKGKLSLLDLFEGRKQLIVYHFMFAPSVSGWPNAGCVGCSLQIDQI